MKENPAAVLKPALKELFLIGWDTCRVILFSAPCGCGKTTTARALLAGHTLCTFSGSEESFSPESIPRDCDTVLVDELHNLLDPQRQQALCRLIYARTDLHFVLLGRGRVPGWLMPFQFAGTMLTVETEALLFDLATARRMLEARGNSVTPEEMSVIQRTFRGYPLAMELLCRRLEQGERYTTSVYEACKRALFVYYDEAVYRRFDLPLRRLLISLAPFENFHLKLAQMVSGEPRAGELLGRVQRDTTMLLFDGRDTYHFWPIFRAFLQWELDQTLSEDERKLLYSRGGLYYELSDELDKALDCYAQADAQQKISELLVKNAEKHPGIGHYREMERYYFALPREEILSSPALLCGMSVLTALCLDYETSEAWYRELQSYGARLKKTDAEYKTVRGKLTYLDIALPQRGCKGLVDLISSIFRVMADKDLTVPAFSVTSTLPSLMNGGKDFCEWAKRDDLLYATMRRPVEAVLGRDGVGLPDCAICESKFEKGEDVSRRMLTLMARLGEIQARGTPDIEFAVLGLLARVQVSQGKAKTALESIRSLREKYQQTGQTRFLGNVDALLCRIQLRLGNMEEARAWLSERAPKNDARLWAMWRYQYLTRVMVQLAEGEYDEPLILLARLKPYCDYCGRVLDGIHIRLLTALCRKRRGDRGWQEELCPALDACREYGLIWPVAQYGVALLPMLRECGWDKSPAYLHRLTVATRAQAVCYPRLMKPRPQLSEPLSAAETQVLGLLCENLSNQEIGEILDIKLATVKTHVSHILQKLGVSRRSEAKDMAQRLHLL